MKGENLSMNSDKMLGHVAECVDILEDFKENSHPIHKVNGHDTAVVNVECDYVSESIEINEALEKNNRLEALNRIEDQSIEHLVFPNCETIAPVSSGSTENSLSCILRTKDKLITSILEEKETQLVIERESNVQIQDLPEMKTVKLENNNSHLNKSTHLDIKSLKMDKLRTVLDSVLKTPLREVLKTKIETLPKFTVKGKCISREKKMESVKGREQRTKENKSSSLPVKRVRFLAENCFKVCDKDEIKNMLSPLMKTSLSEILRSNIARNVNEQNVINSDDSTTDLVHSDYQKALSDGESFVEADTTNNSENYSEINSIRNNKLCTEDTDKNKDHKLNRLNDTNCMNESNNDKLTKSCSLDKNISKNNSMISGSQERWKNAVSPLLKMSISDAIRNKVNKTSQIPNSVIEKNTDKLMHKIISHNSEVPHDKTLNNNRITRINVSARDKYDSFSLSDKSRNGKIKSHFEETSNEEKVSEIIMPNLSSQISESLTIQKVVLPLAIKKKRRKPFKGGKYNLFFSRKKKKPVKIIKDGETTRCTQSEGGSFVTERWASDMSTCDSLSSISSEYNSLFYCTDETNLKKFTERHSKLLKETKSLKINTKNCIQLNSGESQIEYGTIHSKFLPQNNSTPYMMIDSKSLHIEGTIENDKRRKNEINQCKNNSLKYITGEEMTETEQLHSTVGKNDCSSLTTTTIDSYPTSSFDQFTVSKSEDVSQNNINSAMENQQNKKDLHFSYNYTKQIEISERTPSKEEVRNEMDNASFLINKFEISETNSNNEKDYLNTCDVLFPNDTEVLSSEMFTEEFSSFGCNDQVDQIDLHKLLEIDTECSDIYDENSFKGNANSNIESEIIDENTETIQFSNISGMDENSNKRLSPQKAGDRLRELITEKQAMGDNGVFVTITVNAEGIVEDIEKIEPPAFVDLASMSTFVPIEESSEEIVMNSTMPILECVPVNSELNKNVAEIPLSPEPPLIPEPCYTLEVIGDNVSTVTTEQSQESQKEAITFSIAAKPLIENNVIKPTSITTVQENNGKNLLLNVSTGGKENIADVHKRNVSIAGNVKCRPRSKRKFPEDHVDIDCISVSSTSSTDDDVTSVNKKQKKAPVSSSDADKPPQTPSPPKLKLQTCSVYENSQKGGPCHKTLHTNLVGLRLVTRLLSNEQTLLSERTGINLETPGMTICHHHKQVFLDEHEETKKVNSSLSTSICTCYNKPIEKKKEASDTQSLIYCQAKDSIDEKVIGCSNVVINRLLARPSTKVEYVELCEVHLWRLQHHQCCPCCGIFCTQGTFDQCIIQKKSHCQIHLFHSKCISSPINGLGAKCPHCGSGSHFRKIKLELNVHISPSRSKENTIVRSHKYVPTSEPKEDNQKTSETPALVPVNVPNTETLSLNKLQQQALLSSMTGEKSSMRFTVKSFYGPIKTGDVDKFLQMLASGFNPNHRFEDHDNETPLHIAASLGHLALVQLLVQAGASVDHMNNDLFTPLMMAVENNHLSVILYLLAAGAQLDARSDDGTTSLHLAAQRGLGEVCAVILNSGRVDINVQDDGGWTPLVWAAENQHVEVVKLLLKHGADPNVRDDEENVALHWSAFSGNVDISRLFLDVGCELDAANVRGDTPLHISARQGKYECVILFLARGADTKIKNCRSEIPIMCCLDQQSQTWMALSMNCGSKYSPSKLQKTVPKLLHRDLSRGKEFTPIQCLNEVDNKSVPDDFIYIVQNCETHFVNIDKTITSLQSCRCTNNCRYPSCTCATLSFKCWYDKNGHLLPEFNMADPPMIFECNTACLCWKDCSSRVVQYGIKCHLQVFQTERMGWGVRTLQDIPKGTFVCEYVGEYVSEADTDKRPDDSYVFELDCREDTRYCIDAKYFGNVGRFINHLCEANLCPVKVFIEHQDLNFPRIAFFTTRFVKSYEELGFDYGPKYWSAKHKQDWTCFCNSSRCRYSIDKIVTTLNEFHNSEEEATSS